MANPTEAKRIVSADGRAAAVEPAGSTLVAGESVRTGKTSDDVLPSSVGQVDPRFTTPLRRTGAGHGRRAPADDPGPGGTRAHGEHSAASAPLRLPHLPAPERRSADSTTGGVPPQPVAAG